MRTKVSFTCEQCKITFEREKHGNHLYRFCSRKCFDLNRIETKPAQKNQFKCKNCKVAFERKKDGRRTYQFCSKQCNLAFNFLGTKNPRWNGGGYSYRNFLKEQCEKCNSSRNLTIHHKNENHSDNNPTNLQTLCRKCHYFIHTKMFITYDGITLSVKEWARIKNIKYPTLLQRIKLEYSTEEIFSPVKSKR